MEYDSCLALHNPAEEIDWVNVKNRLKPGAFLIAISSTLQHHRITAAIEDCGIEIRDCVMVLGIPSYMVSLGRLPLEGTVAENVLIYGTGALNIDAGRVGTDVVSTHSRGKNSAFPKRPGEKSVEESGRRKDQREGLSHQERSGRWPANTILSNCPIILGKFPNNKGSKPILTKRSPDSGNRKSYGTFNGQPEVLIGYGDTGSTSRFFHNVSEDNSLQELISSLCKLCTPPRGKALVVGLESEAIIGLEGLGFNVSNYHSNE